MMNAEEARQAIYEGKQVVCTKETYQHYIRDALLDYKARGDDLGNKELFTRCKAEIERLDKQFKITN